MDIITRMKEYKLGWEERMVLMSELGLQIEA